MSRNHLLLVLIVASVAPSCTLTPPPIEPPRVELIAHVVDLSASTRDGAERRCLEVTTDLDEAWKASRADRLEVLVLGTGSAPTHEPLTLVGWTTLQDSYVAFSDPEKQASARDASLAELEGRCRAAVRTAGTSAVHQAVARGAESLAARSASLTSAGDHIVARRLRIHSDMRENVAALLRARIQAAARGSRDLPEVGALPLQGVDVRACGTAETEAPSGREAMLPPDALQRAWAGVFGDAAPDTFDPTCSIRPERPAGGTVITTTASTLGR